MGKSGNTPQSSFRLGAEVVNQIRVIAAWLAERDSEPRGMSEAVRYAVRQCYASLPAGPKEKILQNLDRSA